VTTDDARGDVWSDLVNGLLDTRTDPATDRFDAELAAAVDAGEVTAAAAHRLRFWQRAAVRGVADHARSVVPVALGAVDAARRDAQAACDQAASALAGVPTDPTATTDPARPATAAEQAEPDETAPGHDGRVLGSDRRASTPERERPGTLEAPTSRLIVADLRDVAAPSDRA
jgi:hypothetical protein